MAPPLTDAAKRRHRNERILAVLLVVLAGIGVLLLRRYDREQRRELASDQRYVPQKFVMTPEVSLLQEYIRIDTSNPPGKELAGARWLAAQLKQAGIASEIIESAPGRANVYARMRGRRQGEGLLLLNHIDVVPAANDGSWRRPPFSGEIFLDSVYGRGAIDMKGVAICQLAAFLAVAKRATPPERDIVFLAVADEEQGSALGMRWLLEHRPDVVDGVRYAVNEGGITEMSGDSLNYFGIEIGGKGRSLMKARAATREALQQLRIDLEPYYGGKEPEKILPEVEQFFRDVAPQRIMYRRELSDVRAALEHGRFWALPTGYRELTQTSIFGDRITATAGGYEMPVRIYTIPGDRPDRAIETVQHLAAKHGASAELSFTDAGYPLSPRDTPLFEILASAARTRWPASSVGVEVLTTSSNDCRFLRARDIVCYGVAPFPTDYFQSLGVHGVDERVTIPRFQSGVAYMQTIVNRWAEGASVSNPASR